MNKITKLSSVLALLLTTFSAIAQITTDEEPISFRLINLKSAEIAKKTVFKRNSLIDMETVKKEDRVDDADAEKPLRFAFPVYVDYSINNSGEWIKLSNGDKLWRLSLTFGEALSIHVFYDKFWIPKGGKFFVYSNETQQVIGAITSEYLTGSVIEPEPFATSLIYGESITFEYYQPAEVKEDAVISISRIDYGYRFVDNPYSKITPQATTGYGTSGSCQVNINCPEGNNWQKEKHAVARMIVKSTQGSFWCSCALINNTKNDGNPYVLTANHCLKEFDAISNPNASQWIFYWEFEDPGCNRTNNSQLIERSTVGATVIANQNYSDFALLLLSQEPHNTTGVASYFLGWDRTTTLPAGGVGIHHPMGDVKKISTYSQTPATNPDVWGLRWIQTANGYSVTEGGSSGSPLLTSQKRVIGQLQGADAYNYTCSNPSLAPSFYGRFDISWTGNGATDPRRKLQPWLDPLGFGVTALDGSYCNTPRESSISVTVSLYDAYSRIYRAAASCLAATKFEWKTMDSGWTIRNAEAGTTQTMHDVLITPNSSSAPSTSLAVRAYNNCGWSDWILVDRISYNLTYSISTAPNPVSSTLNVNITVNDPLQEQYSSMAEGLGIQQLSTINTGFSGTIEIPASFIIRLYSSFGTLVLQTISSADYPNTQLDVSGLPSGVYYLHVTDGVGGEPQTSTVVVKH